VGCNSSWTEKSVVFFERVLLEFNSPLGSIRGGKLNYYEKYIPEPLGS